MSELLLIRHAEPESAGSYIGRRSDPPLKTQSFDAAETIASILEAEAPAPIYTSPLLRARQTIEPLARRLRLIPKVDEDLAEIDFGEWEGLTWNEIERRDPEIWRGWLDDPWNIPPPEGETLRELSDRVVKAIMRIMDRHEGKKILVASHGGPIRAVLGCALLLDPAAYWAACIDYASLCRFGRKKHGSMELLQWNVSLKNRPNSI